MYAISLYIKIHGSLSASPLGPLSAVWKLAKLGKFTELCKGNFKSDHLDEPPAYFGREGTHFLGQGLRWDINLKWNFQVMWRSVLEQLAPFYFPSRGKVIFLVENQGSYHLIIFIVHIVHIVHIRKSHRVSNAKIIVSLFRLPVTVVAQPLPHPSLKFLLQMPFSFQLKFPSLN